MPQEPQQQDNRPPWEVYAAKTTSSAPAQTTSPPSENSYAYNADASKNMTLAMSGQQKQMNPADQQQFDQGKLAGTKSGLATIGGMVGPALIPELAGTSALAKLGQAGLRVLGSGGGAAGGNVVGQLAGKQNPFDAENLKETGKEAGTWGGLQALGEIPGALRTTAEGIRTRAGGVKPIRQIVADTLLPEPEDIRMGRAQEQARRLDPTETRRVQRNMASGGRGGMVPLAKPGELQPIESLQGEEGIKSSLANPSGRMIKLPSELEAGEGGQLRPAGYGQAQLRAHENGMFYSSGARPAFGGKVPARATPFDIPESVGPREITQFDEFGNPIKKVAGSRGR